MLKQNPIFHAVVAAGYIVLIVVIIQSFSTLSGAEETIWIPIVMLSLFVLSAAVMGYLFFAEPVFLFLEGKKSEAVTFFSSTVLFFALCVAIFVALLFFF